MATASITTYRPSPIPRDVQHFIHTSANEIARTVERHFGSPLEPIEVVLTDADGFVALACQAEQAFAPEMPASRKAKHGRSKRRDVRTHQPSGWTGVNSHGGTLVLLITQASELHTIDSAARVIAHELIHCEQIGRPGVRDQWIAKIRHNLGVAPLDRRTVKAWGRLLEGHEQEAYRLEEPLAEQALRWAGV